jgi:hypothetical protein
MGRQHGVSCSTTQHLIIDSGAVYVNYGELNERKLGATRGGNTFTIETEMRTMEFDGVRGQLIGAHRNLGSIPKITANIAEWNYQTFLDILPGAIKTDIGSTHYRITRTIRRLVASDYLTNIAIVGECTASDTGFIVCGIKNAIQLENLELPFNDKDETVASVTFSGSVYCSDMESEPWWIDYPVDD